MMKTFVFIFSLLTLHELYSMQRSPTEIVESHLKEDSDFDESFDPDQDIILFDFDETMVELWQRGRPRTIRSNGNILRMFLSLRESHPESAFIYSK